jgi:hypothetical protein
LKEKADKSSILIESPSTVDCDISQSSPLDPINRPVAALLDSSAHGVLFEIRATKTAHLIPRLRMVKSAMMPCSRACL